MSLAQAALTVRPGDTAGVREALLDTAGAVLVRGAGTKQEWGAPPERVDTVLDTAGLDHLVEHSAGDMTAIVGAGMPLARLQSALAEHGQRLAIDAPGDGATIGGIYAANDAGPARHRFGTMRDLAIGVTAVLADGTVAHGGGKVVKNVAGFDLVRLLCGSLGTLAVVTQVTVRLHPLPETTQTVRVPADAVTATRLVGALLASHVVPTAVDWHDGALLVLLEGRPQGVSAQVDAVRALTESGCDLLNGDDQAAAWAAATAAHHGEDGETVVRAATLPDRLADVAGTLERVAAAGGVDATLSSHAGIGLHTARLRGSNAAAHAVTVAAFRRSVEALGGTAVLRRRPAGVDDFVDPWRDRRQPEPAAVRVMRQVKQRLDPNRRLAPGRFLDGI